MKPLAWTPADGRPTIASPARHLRGLAADQRAAGLAADFGGPVDEIRDLAEVELGGGDVVQEEERLGAGRDHVVDAVGGHVRAAVPQRAALARDDGLRPDRVHRRGEHPTLVERIQPREGAEAFCAGRLHRGAEPLDDVDGLRQ